MNESEKRTVASSASPEPEKVAENGLLPEILEAVRAKLEPIVGQLEPAQEMRLVEETISLAVQVSGPLPPAIVLKGINDVVPGGAERIIKMAEIDQKHLHAMDRRQIIYPFIYQLIGLVSGALITALAIAGAVFCGVSGQPVLGGILFGGTLLSVVGILVKGAWSQTPKVAPSPPVSKTQPPKKRRRH